MAYIIMLASVCLWISVLSIICLVHGRSWTRPARLCVIIFVGIACGVAMGAVTGIWAADGVVRQVIGNTLLLLIVTPRLSAEFLSHAGGGRQIVWESVAAWLLYTGSMTASAAIVTRMIH